MRLPILLSLPCLQRLPWAIKKKTATCPSIIFNLLVHTMISFRTFIYFFAFIFSYNNLFGQDTLKPKIIKKQMLGITPSNEHRIISGLAIGLTAHPWSTWNDTTYVRVNGLNIEVGPLGIIGGIWGTMHGLIGDKDDLGHKISFFSKSGYEDSLSLRYPKYGTKINGLSFSFGGTEGTYNNGIFINGLSCISYKTNGTQISGLLNYSYEFNGVMIAGICNKTTKGNGIQIGLINNSHSGRILQIGLFNRIGNRVLPFINFKLKRDK
jgi:hypothetical protein